MKRFAVIKYRATRLLRAHQTFVVILITLCILGISFLRVQSLNSIPVDQAYIDDESLHIKTVRFDQEAIEQIKALRDSNVEAPGVNLPGDRQNPFSE